MKDKMQRADRELLRELLSSIIRRWGRDEVLKAIDDEVTESRLARSPRAIRDRVTEGDRHQPLRLNAVEIVEKMDVPTSKKQYLIDIASQFEHKSFLPTISDVRYFLEMRGQNSSNLKQRTDAFRTVAKVIAGLTEDALVKLARSSQHSGPSQLGPLSEAIKAAGVGRANIVREPLVPNRQEKTQNQAQTGKDTIEEPKSELKDRAPGATTTLIPQQNPIDDGKLANNVPSPISLETELPRSETDTLILGNSGNDSRLRKPEPADASTSKTEIQRENAETEDGNGVSAKNYKTMILLEGNTRPFAKDLKKLKGRWVRSLNGWIVDPTVLPRLMVLIPNIKLPE